MDSTDYFVANGWNLVHDVETPDLPPADCVQIIGPGSVGLYPDYHNEEFLIEAVVYTPRGLVYRGKRLSQKGARFEEVTVTAPVDRIVPIAGRSRLVWYNYDTGEILGQDKARQPSAVML